MVEHDWNPSIPETGVGARKAPGQLRLQSKKTRKTRKKTNKKQKGKTLPPAARSL